MMYGEKYWSDRYQQNNTQWDIGYASPPIVDAVMEINNKKTKILFPGCGLGYEAEFLWRNGYTNLYICDLSALPLKAFQKRVPDFPESQLIHGDFFAIRDKFDLIMEQTFFCALPPQVRPQYVAHCATILRKGGEIKGVMFAVEFEKTGPPFGGDKAQYTDLFEAKFEIVKIEICQNSIPERMGNELSIQFKIRD